MVFHGNTIESWYFMEISADYHHEFSMVYMEFHGIPWKYHRIMVLHGNFSGLPHEFSMACCAHLGIPLDSHGNCMVTTVFHGISPGSWSFIAYVFMAPWQFIEVYCYAVSARFTS